MAQTLHVRTYHLLKSKTISDSSFATLSIPSLSPIIECLISLQSSLWRYGATVSTRPFQG